MSTDREKLLQAAAKLVDKKKYDKAVLEYRKIVQSDPSDTLTLLRIGDLESKLGDYGAAIATYDQVARLYANQGFQVKAIAVFKQVRELLKKHAPELAPRYGHVTPMLAQIYADLGLVSDAVTAFDEVATSLQKQGRDREAIAAFKRIVELDPRNPLPHLRLAEACCRTQELDQAIDSFWTAANLLLSMQRPDDALKVIERILHFRQDPLFHRAAAELYLKKNVPQAGMQALAKLQVAFQANPKDLDTLALLAQAFELIGQPDKALAVHLEMGKLAREQGKPELFRDILAHLKRVAPLSDQVLALEKLGPRDSPSSMPGGLGRGAMASEPSVASLRGSRGSESSISSARAKLPPQTSVPDVEVHDDAVELDDEVEYLEEGDLPSSVAPEGSSPVSSIPVVQGAYAIEERRGPSSFRPVSHAQKAIVDAEAFRKLGLLDKAVEALHIALELDPNSVPIRQKLREILVDAGEREPAIVETLNIAIIHLHNQDADAAEPLVYEVLDIEPEHPEALNLLAHVQAMRGGQVEVPDDGHLPSYDIEGVPPSSALGALRNSALPGAPTANSAFPASVPGSVFDAHISPHHVSIPPQSALPHFGDELPPLSVRARPTPEAIEEVLEEAEFFAAQGLYEDAEAILVDILAQVPDHVLLRERLDEVRATRREAEGSAPEPSFPAHEEPTTIDQSFDIAASLDALDGFEQPASLPKVHDPSEEVDVDQVFAKFKEGIKATVDDSDAATHYDLGVAYKEMGLLADAIGEFELASRDPARTCMCYYMIGTVEQLLGNVDRAIAAFEVALGAEVLTVEQEKNLAYELALLFDARGDRAATLRALERVAKRDPNFRDVTARIRALGGTLPLADTTDELDAAFDNLFG